MGLCISSAGADQASPRKAQAATTALVLLPTGELREYPRPATAARALEDAAAGKGKEKEGQWVLCDADGMGFEGPVPAVRGDEELRAGQIYFVLPAAARRGMRREEVVAVAVRASAALAARASSSSSAAATAGRRRRRGAVAPLLFPPPEEEEEEEKRKVVGVVFRSTVPAPSAGGKRVVRPRHRRFASDLTAIPECEISV